MLSVQRVLSARACCFLLAVIFSGLAIAQDSSQGKLYSRVNSFGVFAAYSNDSSRMVAGDASERKLLFLGASYSRQIFLSGVLNWQYDGEVMPVMLDSDPVATTTNTTTYTNPPQTVTTVTQEPTEFACHPSSTTTTTNGVTYASVTTCSRRWTMGGGISPVGFRWNFLPRSSLQPFAVGHGGFIESVNAIPLSDAASFNFTYDMGAGFEWYRPRMRSWRFEARFHHISNKETAPRNPGIDSVLFQVSYVFGR
jgi:hypothetical protein